MGSIILQILIFTISLFVLIIIFQILNSNNNLTEDSKVLLGTATIETMTVGPNPNLAIDMTEFDSQVKPEKSFCNFNGHDLNNLEKECNGLSKDNCSKVTCCGYLNDSKCVNGNKFGPTFRSDKEGNSINIDTYYYMNKCSGPNCPI
jgi:hypothetical protein